MKKIAFFMTVVSVACAGALEQVSLNGLWDFRLEEGKALEEVRGQELGGGEKGKGTRNQSIGQRDEVWDKMVVPGCWDTVSVYYNKRGTGCYRRTFELENSCVNAFLVIDGCGLRSKYWIDGKEIGFSKLPWSKFEFETGPLVAGTHEIVAAVDSLVDNKKVKLFWNFYDFYPFGGFHHGVKLELQRKQVELRRVVVRTRDYKTGLVELEAQFAGLSPNDLKGLSPQGTSQEKSVPGGRGGLSLGDLSLGDFTAEVAFDGGDARKVEFVKGRARVNVPGFKLWSHDAPNLHTVTVKTEAGKVSQRFGIRQVGTDLGRITLNGKSVYLKGVNRHESHYEFGATTPVQLMYEDVKNLKALGGNFIRGSHYAQCEAFLDLCDELGVLVWEESLGWGNRAQQLNDPEFRDLQEEETRLMVRNSINHPCVIISAFLNEPDSNLKECKTLVDRLIDTIRAEDSGHLVTFACHRTANCISHANTDIIAYNTYPCWYSDELDTGSHDEMRANIRACHARIVKYFREKFKDNRPIIVSETGVKADWGVRDPRGKAQYTEDFQDEYEDIMLEEMFAMKDIAGVAIWQFTDAKTYTRTRGLRNRSYGVNTGGLYDLYRRPKMVVESVRKRFTAKSEND